MENHLAELEAKISFSEDLLESLNRIVYQQQQQIDRLQLELRALREQVKDSLPADARGPGEELPPHY
jgi:SlyX protein